MKYHSTARFENRIKSILQLIRELVSRSSGFHASNGSRAVQVDLIARFARPVEPHAPFSLSASPIPVRTDRGVYPRSRN
ncbi:hypothetical protein [Burkholderia contaminans]|uniref:hypothetical protein n=1 Tax=Burkholderia contaminans TaxID=488447 RepID=UPI001582DB95|nr:hypothetical protein [Burkholderia contaminans]